MLITMRAGKDIAEWLNDDELEKTCIESIRKLEKHTPSTHQNKQAAALLAIAGILSSEDASNILLKGGANNFATFYGYYMLEALALDGKYNEAMQIISDRKSTRLNSSHVRISYAVFCLKKKNNKIYYEM